MADFPLLQLLLVADVDMAATESLRDDEAIAAAERRNGLIEII